MAAPDAAFGISITHGAGAVADATQIAVEGELDTATAPRLLEAFHEVVSGASMRELTLDLAQVQFIDSTGLRALIEIDHQAAQESVKLVVVPAAEAVTRLLQVAGVAQRLALVDNGQTRPTELDFLERADLELGSDPLAPSRARASIRELLGDRLDPAALSSVVLMTSELVTNAVLHPTVAETSSVVGLRIVVYPEAVRVEVDDPGQGFDPQEGPREQLRVPGPDQGGRGLFVVDRAAARWGIRRVENDRGSRFAVWFEIESA